MESDRSFGVLAIKVMSLAITATYFLADWVVKGLVDGTFERVGGVIREVATKQVVTWLREVGSNTFVSSKGLADINHRLGGIEQQVGNIQQSLHPIQEILRVTSATSMLNLGVSVMGFAVINHRLNELEQRLKQAQELLNKVNRKIDIGYYANFKAALGLATNAFTMSKAENRERMAVEAINRFLEAEHIYKDYTDQELEQSSQIADEYLLTLSLAYIAEARCHLELGEPDTALCRFQEGAVFLRSRIQKYVDILLTSNPAVYLHPQFKGQIDLRRLTAIYQWIDPALDENDVFELQRENLVKLVQDPKHWLSSLPSAIVDRSEIKGSLWGANPTPLSGRFEKEAYKRLPQTLEVIESLIETNRRFEAYQAEAQAIAQLSVSFHEWLKLTPSQSKPEGAELIFITPSQIKTS